MRKNPKPWRQTRSRIFLDIKDTSARTPKTSASRKYNTTIKTKRWKTLVSHKLLTIPRRVHPLQTTFYICIFSFHKTWNLVGHKLPTITWRVHPLQTTFYIDSLFGHLIKQQDTHLCQTPENLELHIPRSFNLQNLNRTHESSLSLNRNPNLTQSIKYFIPSAPSFLIIKLLPISPTSFFSLQYI